MHKSEGLWNIYLSLNNCLLWDKAVCSKRKEGLCRSWILEGEYLSPMDGGETWGLSLVLREHLEDSERCLTRFLVHCRANIAVYEHWECPLLLRKTSPDPSLHAQQGCIDRKVRATPGDGGCPPRAQAVWLLSLFKAFTSVPLATQLLIILLSSASTHFSQESTRRGFLSTSSVSRQVALLFLSLKYTDLWDTS